MYVFIYLRHKLKGIMFPALVQCFGPCLPFSNRVVFESPSPPVLWSSGPLLLPSFGESSALKQF
jgi:hypothetical protein